MVRKKKIIFIVGPTAVGKSRLAIDLAKKINGEIVSCDSMQIYKGLDILSAKPSKSEMKKIKHHLVSAIRPSQDFDVSKFIKSSRQLIDEVHGRNKTPIFVGGTGLYMDCLLNGIFEGPKKNPKIRVKLNKLARSHGNIYLYNKLKKVDRQSAKKIHVNDLRRIIRALEVYQITKRPLSVLKRNRRGILQDKRFKIFIFGIIMSREKIYKNINKRVDEMFSKGAIREAKRILSGKCSKTFKQALGIKEIREYLKGSISLEQARQLLKQNTRRYAKRQITWFRKNTRIYWLEKGALTQIIHILDNKN